MSRISFTVSDLQRAEIEQYLKGKKRWRDASALARDAFWQTIARNPLYIKKGRKTASESENGRLCDFPPGVPAQCCEVGQAEDAGEVTDIA